MPKDNKIHILVVDDSVTIRRTIVKQLSGEYITHEAADGEAAWKLLESNKSISLVFADMHMPVMNGMLLLKKIRSSKSERIASLPVIIITGYDNADAAKRASHNIGATDFISKPFDSFDILDKVASYIKLDRKILKKKSKDTHDKLTGLLNESSFIAHAERTLEHAHGGNLDTSLIFMRIVGLSDVFKAYGEKTTKQIITTVAKYLSDAMRGNEKVAHLGSGKFSIVLPVTNEFKANIIAIRLQKMVSQLAFEKGDAAIRIKMAVGISSTNGSESALSFIDLRAQSEHAMQMSLEQPGSPIIRFDETYENRCIEEERSKKPEQEKHSSKITHTDADVREWNKYLASVLTGDFDKVPAHYVESMIEPLQNFLEHAYKTTEIGKRKKA